MARSNPRSPDVRLVSLAGQSFDFPDTELAQVDRARLPLAIELLQAAEVSARRLRQRLEALHARTSRPCPVCGTPVTGRIDRVYCGDRCRQRAHRAGTSTHPRRRGVRPGGASEPAP